MLEKTTAAIALTLLLTSCGKPQQPIPHAGLRVVSMAPSITEILYALELGDRVVGVSKFSVYPPEAASKPTVGGTYDPNWEQIVSLQPDLVIGLDSQSEIASQLDQLDIRFLGVPHEHIEEILESILLIGDACEATPQAQTLYRTLTKTLEVAPRATTASPARILICIGHDATLSRMYIAAKNTFYDDLIACAGGTNACEQSGIKYPEISPEGLRAIDPDLVIDLVPPIETIPPDYANIWSPYRAIIMTNQYAFIPGPRFNLLIADLKEAIRQSRKTPRAPAPH